MTMVEMNGNGRRLHDVAISLLVLTLTSFVLRVYVRTYLVKAFGLDDWFMSLATIAYILFIVCILISIQYGNGHLSTEISPANYSEAMKYWLFCYIGYTWTMIFSKISIAIFLLRIIVEKAHLWLIYIALGINVVSGLVFFMVTLFECHPISFFWNKTIPGGACLSVDVIVAMVYLYSAFNIICDFTFALLPIVIVQGLNMTRKLKLAIIPLLSMGCIASAAVCVRLAYVQAFRNPEFLSATTDIAIWSSIESGLAVTAGSLACIRPLFKLALQRLGMLSDVYFFHPSVPLRGGTGATGGGTGADRLDRASRRQTIGTGRSHHKKDAFNMTSLFSRSDDIDDDDAFDKHSVGGSSTKKMVLAPGGIMKTSDYEVRVEDLGPADGPGASKESLGRGPSAPGPARMV